MAKSKKPKKPVNLKPEFVLDPKLQQKHKKKKKNAPDRPQPEWMFPPDEENPVLNPKTKPQEQLDKEKADHDRVIKYLQYRSVSTPVKAPPPALLLTLVGAFLTSYGFNSASRLYTTELKARQKLDEWKLLLDKKLPKDFPDLVKLFKAGQKTYEEQKASDETSSDESEDESDDDDEDDENPPKKSSGGAKANTLASKKNAETSDQSLDSDDSDDSDEDMEDASPPIISAKGSKPSTNQASSSSDSSSDSDADDEDEPSGAQINPAKASVALTNDKPIDGSKQKPSPKANNFTELDASAGSTLPKYPETKKSPSSSSDDRSSSSSEASDSDSSSPKNPPTNSTIHALVSASADTRHGSSSSETLKGNSDQKATTSATSITSSSSDSDSEDESDSSEPATSGAPTTKESSSPTTSASKAATKRKHASDSDEAPPPLSKKQAQEPKQINPPFERVPKDTPVDSRFSNKYKSYDYADRAYQDLSVTKGKGFTKEKNKKKRGSYRGGGD